MRPTRLRPTPLGWAVIALATAVVAGILLYALLGSDGDSDPSSTTGPDTFAYDASVPLEAEETPGAATPEHEVLSVTYTGYRGRRVKAVLSLPRDADAPYRCVISQGGLGYSLVQFRAEEQEPAPGLAVFSMQPRFSGDTGREQLRAALNASTLEQLLRETVLDLRRGIDYLESSGHCVEGVGFVGTSLGGMMGALLAGSDDRVAATALLVAGGDWKAVLAGAPDVLVPGANEAGALREAARTLAPVDPAAWVGRISPRPVLMLNGRLDTLITPEAARALHDAALEPKEVVWFEGGHGPFVGAVGEQVFTAIREFFEAEL